MSFQNWHKEFDKFWPEHSKVSKHFTLISSFWAKYILFEVKKVQRRYLLWSWRGIQSLERNRLVVSKLTSGNWQILTWALKSLKTFYFNKLLLSKVYIVWGKKSTEEVSFMKLKRDAKFGEESTCRFKNDIRKLTNFDLSTWKSQKFPL